MNKEYLTTKKKHQPIRSLQIQRGSVHARDKPIKTSSSMTGMTTNM